MSDDRTAAEGLPSISAVARLKKVVRPLMGLLAAVFVVLAARDLQQRWVSAPVRLSYGYLVASAVPLFAGGLTMAIGWTWLVRWLSGAPVPMKPAIAVHAASQLARYTPGKMGVPFVRMMAAPELGASGRVLMSSVFIELISWVAVGGALGFALLSGSGELARRAGETLGTLGFLSFAGFAFALVLLLVVDRRVMPAKVRGLLHLEGAGPLVPPRLPAIQVAHWLSWAAHGYLLARAVSAPHSVALTACGAFVVAPILGFLALAAPGGLGVREAVISVALAPAIGSAAALYCALLSRALGVAVECVTWLALRSFRVKTATAAPSQLG